MNARHFLQIALKKDIEVAEGMHEVVRSLMELAHNSNERSEKREKIVRSIRDFIVVYSIKRRKTMRGADFLMLFNGT